MKKFTLLMCVAVFASFSAHAQYYLNAFPNIGTNPGGINTDPEQPFGAAGVTTGDGYSALIANGITALQWSASQTIPFSFDFNGSPVTSFKVSNSGVLTFDVSATTVPPFNNDTIPNASIPNNSVMAWGLQQSVGSANDGVIQKTFGTAPNRQHWVTFASFSAPGATGSQWTYWSIVLEETTNNIYVVDQRNFNTPLSLTVGIQIDANTVLQVSGSPNIASNTVAGGNQSDPLDNTYWEFIQGSRSTDDARLLSIDIPSSAVNATSVPISGEVANNGSAALNSVIVNWSANNGPVNSDTLSVSLTSPNSANFTHNVSWTAANPGASNDIKVWVSMPNGNMDGNALNDTLSASVFVTTGNTVARNPLFEEFTTAVCQFCPDGHLIQEQIVAALPQIIPVGVHACFNEDAMTVNEALDLCGTLGNNSAPTAMVDRTLFPGNATVAFSRAAGAWNNACSTRAATGAPVDVTLTGNYNFVTRLMDIDVDVSFVDFVEPGDLRVSLMLLEDSLSGTGFPTGSGPGTDYTNAWNQYNWYYGNGPANHPFRNIGTPFAAPNQTISFIPNYEHRHVLRDIYPSTWGDSSVVPANYQLNTNYSRNFQETLDVSTDLDQVYLVAVVSYFGGGDASNYQVLNARELKLNTIVSVEENTDALAQSLKVYPNPSDLPYTYMEFNIDQMANVQTTVTDITGKVVAVQDFGTMSQGNQRIQLNTDRLENGFYFVNLRVGEQEVSRKISILK